MKNTLLVIIFLISGCGILGKSCPTIRGADGMGPAYSVKITGKTPKGAKLDLGGHDIDPVKIDALMDRVDGCMMSILVNGELPREVMYAAHCYDRDPKKPSRKCVTIKIGEWTVGCGGDQVLTWHAPDRGCQLKGVTPTEECPCRWRSGVQKGSTIVTTPDFYLFADWYVRVFWNCANPWGHPLTAKCVSQGRIE